MADENEGGKQTQITDPSQKTGSEDPPESTDKTINISGKSFVVGEDVAQAITEFTQDVDRRFDERSQELGRLRGFETDVLQKEKQAQDAANKQEPPDLATLMYEDPGKFVDVLRSENQKQIDGLRNEYQQAKSTEKEEVNFWNSMWEENKDLALIKTQSTDVLKMVGQKYASQNLPNTRKVRDFFAKEAREWMKGIIGANANGDNDAFVEGSTTTTPTKPKKAEEGPRKTTKQILESNRERKRKAMAERT